MVSKTTTNDTNSANNNAKQRNAATKKRDEHCAEPEQQAKVAKENCCSSTTQCTTVAAPTNLVEQLFSSDALPSMIEAAEKNFADVDKMLQQIEQEASAQVRMLENEFHAKKTKHFEERSRIISTHHKNFWPLMFINNPNIELFINLGAKADKVQKADLEMCQAIRAVQCEVKNTDDKFCTRITLQFAANDYFENSEIMRSVTREEIMRPEEGMEDSKYEVEVTELKPKAKLKQLIDAYKKAENDSAVPGFVDETQIPFVVMFTDKNNLLMNDFVQSMKSIHNDPIGDLKQALMNEDDDCDFDDDSSDDDEDDDELESIEEEPEEEEEQEAQQKKKQK